MNNQAPNVQAYAARKRAEREYVKFMRPAREAAMPVFRSSMGAYRRGVAKEIAGRYTGGVGNNFATGMNTNAAVKRAAANALRRGVSAAERNALATSRNAPKQILKRLLNKPVANWRTADFANLQIVGKSRYMNAVNKIGATNMGANKAQRLNAAVNNSFRTGLGRMGRARQNIRGLRERAQNFGGRFRSGIQKKRAQLAQFGRQRAAGAGRAYGAASRGAGRFYGAAYGAGHAIGNRPRAWARARKYGVPLAGNIGNNNMSAGKRLQARVNESYLASRLH